MSTLSGNKSEEGKNKSEQQSDKSNESSIQDKLFKINHQILDVRCRVLRSVVFKLGNDLIKPSDLINEKDFLMHLLEWFNFEDWAMESQVLGLLCQLSEHEEAANTLVELGGVEFLSQLRLHCDPSLHFFIDETLEHLLKLPHHLFPTAGPSSPLPHTSMNLPLPHTGMHLSTKSLTTEQLATQVTSSTFGSEYTTDMGSYVLPDGSEQLDPFSKSSDILSKPSDPAEVLSRHSSKSSEIFSKHLDPDSEIVSKHSDPASRHSDISKHSEISSKHSDPVSRHSEISEHSEILFNRSDTLSKHSKIPSKHFDLVSRHSETLSKHSLKHSDLVSRHSDTLSKHSGPVSRHSETLSKHSDLVSRHSETLSKHSLSKHSEIESAEIPLKHSDLVSRHSDTLSKHSGPVSRHSETLSKHSDLVSRHSETLSKHSLSKHSEIESAEIPLKHSDLVSRHSDTLSKHSGPVSRHSETLSKHSDPVSRHSEILSKHSDPVSRHSETLSKHSEIPLKHSDLVSRHSEALSKHSEIPLIHADLVSRHSETLSKHSGPVSRHSEILSEHSEIHSKDPDPVSKHSEILSRHLSSDPVSRHSEILSKDPDPVSKHSEILSRHLSSDPVSRHSEILSKDPDPVSKHSEILSRHLSSDPVSRHSEILSKDLDPVSKHSEILSKDLDPVSRHSEIILSRHSSSGPVTRHSEILSKYSETLSKDPDPVSGPSEIPPKHSETLAKVPDPVSRHSETPPKHSETLVKDPDPVSRHSETPPKHSETLAKDPEAVSGRSIILSKHSEIPSDLVSGLLSKLSDPVSGLKVPPRHSHPISRHSEALSRPPDSSNSSPLMNLPFSTVLSSSSSGSESSRVQFKTESSSSHGMSWAKAFTEKNVEVNFPYSVSTVIPQGAPCRCEGEGVNSNGSNNGRDSNLTVLGQFPWLRLTANDHHILVTTQSRLDNPDSPEAISRCCEFLQEVLFQDFPPELFLQRPTLINHLLQLLMSEVGSPSHFLSSAHASSPSHFPCLLCLLTYSRKLSLRVRVRDSPSSIITYHSPLPPEGPSQDQAQWSHEQAANQSSDHVTMEYLPGDMLYRLQSNQLSVGAFASALISSGGSLLLACLDKDAASPSDQGESLMASSVSMCVLVCLQLVECAVELVECDSTSGMLIQQDSRPNESVWHCINSVCSTLSQCLSKWRRMSSQITSSSPHLQIVCCVTLDLGHYLNRLLLLRGDLLNQGNAVVSSLSSVLQGFMMSGIVGVVFPDLQNSLLQVFVELDPPNSRLFSRVKAFGESFEWKSTFLASPTNCIEDAGVSLKLLQQASNALPALWFISDERFVAKAVTLCLDCLEKSVVSGEEKQQSKELLVKLLCHGDRNSEIVAYKYFTQRLRGFFANPLFPLNSSLLEDPALEGLPTSSSPRKASFLAPPSARPHSPTRSSMPVFSTQAPMSPESPTRSSLPPPPPSPTRVSLAVPPTRGSLPTGSLPQEPKSPAKDLLSPPSPRNSLPVSPTPGLLAPPTSPPRLSLPVSPTGSSVLLPPRRSSLAPTMSSMGMSSSLANARSMSIMGAVAWRGSITTTKCGACSVQRDKLEEDKVDTTLRDRFFAVVLDPQMLHLLATQGFVSRSGPISCMSLQVLVDVFSMREELCWPEIRNGLIPVLPYIEVGVVENEQLFDELKLVLTEADEFPIITRLHSFLRLLYSDSTNVRQWSYSQLTWLVSLTLETNSIHLKSSVPYHDALVSGKYLGKFITKKKIGAFKRGSLIKLIDILKSDNINIGASLKKSALEQLSILLQDDSLHEAMLEEELHICLIAMVESTVRLIDKPGRSCCDSDHDLSGELGLLDPCVSCLFVLAMCNHSIRVALREDQKFLLHVLRAAWWNYSRAQFLLLASRLLALLVFPEKEMTVGQDCKLHLPKALAQRLKFPFEVEHYDQDHENSTPSPLEPSLFTTEPLVSMLRMQYLYHSARDVIIEGKNNTGLEQKLQVPSSDLVVLRCLKLKQSISGYLKLLASASSHRKVTETLQYILIIAHTIHCVGGGSGTSFPDDIGLLWMEVAERFLKVSPRTPKDYFLLESVLFFLSNLLSVPHTTNSALSQPVATYEELKWLCGASFDTDSVPTQLLQSSLRGTDEAAEENKRSLQKEILKFFVTLLSRLTYEPCVVNFDLTPLILTLSQCLDITGSPSYYDIPLLELSLECLLKLTDRKLFGGVSSRSVLGLSMKLMSLLRQVLWSFMSGQGRTVGSFMGKGVIARASLAMSHLLHTTETHLHPPQEWWLQWLHCSADHPDLVWLQLLVEDRDPNVRYAGLSLLASLCSKPGVTQVLLEVWGAVHPLSLWGSCVKIALEPIESSIVRKQALLVMSGLSAMCNKEKKWDCYLVHTTEDRTISGEEVLALLLDSFKFLRVLQYSVGNESLLPLSKQISAQLHGLVSDGRILRILIPVSHYTSSQRSLADVSSSGLTEPDDPGSDSPGVLNQLLCEVVSTCNPHVVSGQCCFLHNLFLAFPKFMTKHCYENATVVQLASLLDPTITGAFLLAGHRGYISEYLQCTWTKMCIRVMDLLELMAMINADAVLPCVLREGMVEGLCQMLAQCFLAVAMESALPLASAIVFLLLGLVNVAPSLSGRELVLSCLQLHWSSFTGLILHCLDSYTTTPSHQFCSGALKLLSVLLMHRFRPHSPRSPGKRGLSDSLTVDPTQSPLSAALVHMLDGDLDQEEYTANTCCGALLCKALMKVQDCFTLTQVPAERQKLIANVLAILLACSFSARKVALDGGLLQCCLEQLKSLHAKLCADTLEQTLTASRRKKDSPIVQELVLVLSLCRNFMYKSQPMKRAFLKSHLPELLHKIWPSCTVNKNLLLAVVDLLIVFTAQNPEGRVSLASSCKGTSCFLQDILKHISHAMSSYQSCATTKIANPHIQVLGPLFTLLANSALSPECRAVFKKTNFLSGFTRMMPKSEKTALLHQEKPSSMWVRLLVNLSFFTEGQAAIIKTPGILDVLLEIYGCGHFDSHTHCLLILRNLSFHTPSKGVLTNNSGILNVLMSGLESVHLDRVTLAVSALWSLIHNNSKARNSFRKTGLSDKLQSVSLTARQLYLSSGATSSSPTTTTTAAAGGGSGGEFGLLSREQCLQLSQEAFSNVIQLLQ